MGETATDPKPRLSWYQYRLAHLFVFLTICAGASSWFASRMANAQSGSYHHAPRARPALLHVQWQADGNTPEEKAAYARIRDLGGEVLHAYNRDDRSLHLRLGMRTRDSDLVHLKHIHPIVSLDVNSPYVSLRKLLEIPSLKKIRALDLTNCDLKNSDMDDVVKFQQIASLCLDGTLVTDAAISDLSRLPNLADLHVGRTKVTRAGFVHLKGCAKLTSVGFRGHDLTDDDLKHLSEVVNLRELRLQGTKVTDAGLAHLEAMTNLRYLCTYRTRITRGGISRFSRKMPQVQNS